MPTLNRLKEIKDLRTVWPNEAQDFTPWLSLDENIALLSEAVGIDIIVSETESSVGRFNVDIFASESGTDRKIIIENQLDTTNHDHLGKLITYASGKSANVIIWMVKQARDEHRAAIEWLNNHTDGNISFYLCEIKLFQIGASEPAVKFEVIEKPLALPMPQATIHKNYYIEILDFLKLYGGSPYMDPMSATDQPQKTKLMMLKEKAREVSRMMFEICSEFAAQFNLTLNNTVKRWLNVRGTSIRDYFWGQLKRQDSNSPISLSIFAEKNHYRIALELDVKKASDSDYQAFNRYLLRPIDTTRLKFFGKPTSSADASEILLDLTKEEVINRLKASNNIEDRVQLSYFIYRNDNATNSDKTDSMFYQEFSDGLSLLLPYYNYVIDSYCSENG